MAAKRFDELEHSIQRALERAGGEVACVGRGNWTLHPETSVDNPIEVRLRDQWVLCETPAPDPRVNGDFERYVSWNSRLAGGCKVALAWDRMAASVREEIPAIDDVDLSSACGEAIAHLASARDIVAKRRKLPARAKKAPRNSQAAEAALAQVLAETCEAAGWSYSESDGELPVVSLGLTSGSYPSFAEARNDHDYRIYARLTRYKSLTEVSRRAVAAFLLTVNGVVRFVRTGLEDAADGVSAFVEARFSACPTPAVLDVALSALAVTCAMCDRELRALQSEMVAKHYLTARGVSLVQKKAVSACG